jgi:hypothetical protein
MTSDEWRVQGIEFALSAEGENTTMFLDKAARCFTLANDVQLASRALLQMDMAGLLERLLRVRLEGRQLNDREEQDAAQVVLRAVRLGGMLREVREMSGMLKGVVRNSELFEWEVMSMLNFN